jgi:hypothetical protein
MSSRKRHVSGLPCLDWPGALSRTRKGLRSSNPGCGGGRRALTGGQPHLTLVLGKLLRESRLSEEEVRGLGEDKLESIRSYAGSLAKIDAA